MYDNIEVELRGVQQALQSSCTVSTMLLPTGELELGDEPAQLHRLADVTEARLHHAQEEIEQATYTLKQVQGVLIEQHQVEEQEKVSLWAKFEEEKTQMQQEKEQLLAKQLEVKEAINRALHPVTGLDPQEEYRVTHQVENLAEAIQ
jgi:hypothetical protein